MAAALLQHRAEQEALIWCLGSRQEDRYTLRCSSQPTCAHRSLSRGALAHVSSPTSGTVGHVCVPDANGDAYLVWIREEPGQGGGGGWTSVASEFFNGMAPKHLKPRGSPADACSSGAGTLGGAISTQVPSHRNPGVHRCTPSPGSDPTSVPLSSGSSSQLYDFRVGPQGVPPDYCPSHLTGSSVSTLTLSNSFSTELPQRPF